MKMKLISIEIPESIVKEAKRKGVDFEHIRAVAREFVLLELIAQMSKLTKKDAVKISEKIKSNAWKKLKKQL